MSKVRFFCTHCNSFVDETQIVPDLTSWKPTPGAEAGVLNVLCKACHDKNQ